MIDPSGRDKPADSGSGSSSARSEGSPNELVLLRAAMEAIGEAIIITDAALDLPGPRIQYVNPAFTSITGYAPDEVVGRTPRLLQGPNTDRAVLNELRAALSSGQSFKGETVNYRKDGSQYIVEWLITPVLEGGRVTHWVAAQRDVTELRDSKQRQRRLAAEVNHRVNNTLAAVQSVAAQTAPREETAAGFKAAFQERLRALVSVHRLLARGKWNGVLLAELADAQAAPYLGGGPGRFRVTGPEILLRPNAAVALGMALSELAANAAHYGALSVPDGSVHLRWDIRAGSGGDKLSLRWAEAGGPPVAKVPPQRGFGSRLVERNLPQELHAEARLVFEPSGLRCEIDVSVNAVIGAPPWH